MQHHWKTRPVVDASRDRDPQKLQRLFPDHRSLATDTAAEMAVGLLDPMSLQQTWCVTQDV